MTKYLQGVFATRPALPRYNRIWDVSLVLKYIKSLGENENLTLQNLTLKTTMLLALVSGQRCQTLHALNVQNMALNDNMCTFKIAELLKTTRPGWHLGHIELKAYKDDSCLCVVTALQQYMVISDLTQKITGQNQEVSHSHHHPEPVHEIRCRITGRREARYREQLQELRQCMTEEQIRANDIAQLKGSSIWLTALPLVDEGYVLSKREFFDAIYLRYRWQLKRLPSHCVCGKLFTVDHALSCLKGGFIHRRHVAGRHSIL